MNLDMNEVDSNAVLVHVSGAYEAKLSIYVPYVRCSLAPLIGRRAKPILRYR